MDPLDEGPIKEKGERHLKRAQELIREAEKCTPQKPLQSHAHRWDRSDGVEHRDAKCRCYEEAINHIRRGITLSPKNLGLYHAAATAYEGESSSIPEMGPGSSVCMCVCVTLGVFDYSSAISHLRYAIRTITSSDTRTNHFLASLLIKRSEAILSTHAHIYLSPQVLSNSLNLTSPVVNYSTR